MYSIIWKGIFMKNKVQWTNSLAIFERAVQIREYVLVFFFLSEQEKTKYDRTLTCHMHARCEWHQMLPESSAWLYKQLANNMWRLQRQRERCRYNVRLEIKWKCLASHHKAGNQMKTQQPKVDRFRSCTGWLSVPPVWRENKDILVGKEIKCDTLQKKILFFLAVIVQRTRSLIMNQSA